MLKKYRIDIAICSFLIFFAFIYFLNLFYPHLQIFSTPDFGQSDLWNFNIPFKYYLSLALQANSIPFWTNLIGNGFPLFGEGQIGTLNPTNLILLKFLPFEIAFNLIYPVTFSFMSIGMYLLVKQLNLNRLTAVFVSIIYSYSAYFIVQIPHIDLLETVAFLPWSFLAIYFLFLYKNFLSVFFYAVILALSIFSGYAQITFIQLIGNSLFFIFLVYCNLSKNKKIKLLSQSILLLAWSMILGLLLSAIQLFPTLEFVSQSVRNSGLSLQDATYFSFPIQHFLTFINPYMLGNPKIGTYPPFANFNGSIFWENSGYIGIIPLIFATAALFLFKKNKHILFFSLLTLLAGLLMLGSKSPLAFIYFLPGFSLFRVPSRFIILFVFALCMMAGIFFNYLISICKFKYGSKVSLGIGIILISLSFLDLYTSFYNYNALIPSDKIVQPPQTVQLLQQLHIKRIYTFGDEIVWNNVFLKQGWSDMNSYNFELNNLRQNRNMIFGVQNINSYTGNFLPSLSYYDGLINNGILVNKKNQISFNSSSIRLLQQLGVGAVITPYTITNLSLVKKTDGTGLSSFKIYRLPQIQIPLLLYNKVLAASDFTTQIEGLDLTKQVLLEGDDGLNCCSIPTNKATIQPLEKTNSSMIYSIKNNPTAGYLVIPLTYYPGWHVTIDNDPAQNFAANIEEQAVYVPPGNHTITFWYDSQSFHIGSLVSLCSLLLSLVYLFLWKRKLITIRYESKK